MNDPRFARLANLLVTHSTALQKGEHILIEAFDIPEAMTIELVRAARAVGANPHVACRNGRIQRELVDGSSAEGLSTWAAYDLERMKRMDAYIGLRGSNNINEMSGVDDEDMKNYMGLYGKPVHSQERVNNTRWCVLRWPSPSMAQLAKMNTSRFEDFYFDVCTLDYTRMQKAAEVLAERMARTDRVRIEGPGDTDLSFSIKGVQVIPCCGTHNIPDGECFTAPVRDSVNGVIHYNTPTIYNGISFSNVRLEFKDGRIIGSSCDSGNDDALESIFDTDEGARYVGEFAIGFNPYIMDPMMDILFDEKIAGSFHFTPGQAYEDANNDNKSQIHWDLVAIQRPEYGGGTISFDDELIRKDGLFVTEELQALNPEQLIGS
ncbi:MAG: aminopeptidase [Phycisphaerae bacterium]|nr:aminopeptidase [Phycisphaerae bacterium]